MNPTHVSRRALLRGAAASSLCLAFALALSGCKGADQTGTASSGGASDASTSTASTGETLTIGHFGSLTGSEATFGTSTDQGIRMAFDEVNAKGGVLGKKLNLVTEDDGSQDSQVSVVVNKLINGSNILCLMGEVASSRSLVAAPIAQKAGVPMVTASSTSPKVTQVGNYIFRTCFIDPFQGTVMSKFARETLKVKKVAILTDNSSDYSKGLTQFFLADWTKNGGQIVSSESYKKGDEDFNSQLTQIKATAPDAVYIPGYYTAVGNIAVQARRLGINVPLMGGDGWDSPKLFDIGGAALDGCYFSNHYSSQSKDPRVVAFVAAYKAKYGAVPDGLGAVAYDAGNIVADAIKRAGSADRTKLRDALANTKNFSGVTGTITIDKDRNAIKPAVVLKIQNNAANYVATVKP